MLDRNWAGGILQAASDIFSQLGMHLVMTPSQVRSWSPERTVEISLMVYR